ncbi:MAG: type II secretion system F family protein [Candidatus Omnitrophica bacterium]|nr:type II secretion system F family protein [Candidatus Omnitrophota bacterium]
MPNYTYRARDREGKSAEGELEAASQEAAVAALQEKGFFVTFVAEKKAAVKSPTTTTARRGPGKRRMHRKVKLDDLILFARQLATMLESGVNLLRSITILIGQVESRQLMEAVTDIKENVEKGTSLRDSLAKYPRIFSSMWVNLVEVGEATGELPAILNQLSAYLESTSALQRKIKGALVYPIILVVASVGAITVFMVKIIPMFVDIFKGFDMKLPALTEAVFTASVYCRQYFPHGVGILIGLAVIMRFVIRTEKGRYAVDRMLLGIPVLGLLILQGAVVRFARSLAMLVRSGSPLLYSLDIISRIVNNKFLERALLRTKDGIQEGRGMAEVLEEEAVFPPIVHEMVRVGEETGKLTDMLDRLGDFFDERVSASVQRMASMFEPILLIFMGGVIGTLVMAMFLPIFNMSQIGGG